MNPVLPNEVKSLTASELIRHLQESIDEYPEYADTELRGVNEYGEEFRLTGTDISGDIWLVVEEVHARTGECACGARCDHESVTGMKAWVRRWLRW